MDSKNTHVLELNGRRYNAMTGALLSDMQKSVDGFIPKTTHQAAPATTVIRPTAIRREAIATPASPKLHDVHRPPAHHHRPHQLQHSQTLMRHAVHRPDGSLKRHVKVATHTGLLAKSGNFDVIPKYSVTAVDPGRLQRAHKIAKSGLVRRFAALPVHAEPIPLPKAPQAATTATQAAPKPTAAHQPSYDIFERALAAAESHKQPRVPLKHKTKKTHRVRRFTSVAASMVAVLLIAGFVAYQNVAFIQLRLASSHAGINATLPAWQPSGFQVGALTSGPGSVTVSYKSKSGQQFTIAQSSSNWDSSTLLSEYVYPHNETYDTVSAAGSTIYTYGNNDATWVNNGIWYKLTSNGSLSTSQIVNIATSMQS